MKNYKQFKELFRFFARKFYPSNYRKLQWFILSSLQEILNSIRLDADSLLQLKTVNPVLSICKVVMKEYSSKRLAHNKDHFKEFISPVVAKAIEISTLLSLFITSFNSSEKDRVVPALQLLRKCDKITVYGLLSIPSQYQAQPQIQDLMSKITNKIRQFHNILVYSELDDQVRR